MGPLLRGEGNVTVSEGSEEKDCELPRIDGTNSAKMSLRSFRH